MRYLSEPVRNGANNYLTKYPVKRVLNKRIACQNEARLNTGVLLRVLPMSPPYTINDSNSLRFNYVLYVPCVPARSYLPFIKIRIIAM